MRSIMVTGAGASGYVNGIRYKKSWAIRHYMQAVEGKCARQENVWVRQKWWKEEMFAGLWKQAFLEAFEEKFGVVTNNMDG